MVLKPANDVGQCYTSFTIRSWSVPTAVSGVAAFPQSKTTNFNSRTPVCLCTKSAQALYRGRRGEEMGHRREGKLIMDVQPSTRAQCWPSVFVQLYNQMSEWGRPRRTSGFCKDSHTLPSTDSTVMTCSSVMWLPSTAFTVTATGGTSPRQRILGISRSYPCNSPNQSVIWLT